MNIGELLDALAAEENQYAYVAVGDACIAAMSHNDVDGGLLLTIGGKPVQVAQLSRMVVNLFDQPLTKTEAGDPPTLSSVTLTRDDDIAAMGETDAAPRPVTGLSHDEDGTVRIDYA